jgi:hypothetical protein
MQANRYITPPATRPQPAIGATQYHNTETGTLRQWNSIRRAITVKENRGLSSAADFVPEATRLANLVDRVEENDTAYFGGGQIRGALSDAVKGDLQRLQYKNTPTLGHPFPHQG